MDPMVLQVMTSRHRRPLSAIDLRSALLRDGAFHARSNSAGESVWPSAMAGEHYNAPFGGMASWPYATI